MKIIRRASRFACPIHVTRTTGSLRPTAMRSALLFKAALFTLLVPSTFGLYVPYRIALAGGHIPLPALSFPTAAAYLLMLTGISVYVRCAWDFVTRGLGTPAPWTSPRRLVVEGLYRWTRNPMYNGVFLSILAQAWLARSLDIVAYFTCLSLGLHLFVVLYEEPHLRTQFGVAYAAYSSAVPRWGVTFSPYRAEDDAVAHERAQRRRDADGREWNATA